MKLKLSLEEAAVWLNGYGHEHVFAEKAKRVTMVTVEKSNSGYSSASEQLELTIEDGAENPDDTQT